MRYKLRTKALVLVFRKTYFRGTVSSAQFLKTSLQLNYFTDGAVPVPAALQESRFPGILAQGKTR
jgi:hypothetical protein